MLFLINFATAKHEHVNLIIDIGNTLAKLVAFDGDTPVEEIKTSNETLERLPEFVNKYAFNKVICRKLYSAHLQKRRQLKGFDFLAVLMHRLRPDHNDYRTPDTFGSGPVGCGRRRLHAIPRA